MEKFSISVPDSVLTDLHDRLARARYPNDLGNDQWAYGTNAEYLKELCTYWRTGFDWRAQERAINALPHYRTTIEGNPIHFIHQPGKGPKPIPIILNHGWPWTFWDMNKIIGPLSDPAAYGGDPADAFDVIVPSLPGYGYSTPLANTGLNFWRTADLWVQLMQDKLGYKRFASYGGDWGSLVTAQLGHKHADKLYGVYVSLPLPLDLFFSPLPGPEQYAADEKNWHAENELFFATESGYSAIQATKPQSLGYGLADSPVAQCAWILEKRRTWSHCKGNVESVFSKDELLTTTTSAPTIRGSLRTIAIRGWKHRPALRCSRTISFVYRSHGRRKTTISRAIGAFPKAAISRRWNNPTSSSRNCASFSARCAEVDAEANNFRYPQVKSRYGKFQRQ